MAAILRTFSRSIAISRCLEGARPTYQRLKLRAPGRGLRGLSCLSSMPVIAVVADASSANGKALLELLPQVSELLGSTYQTEAIVVE